MANTLSSGSFCTKSFNSLISFLESPGISIPWAVHIAVRTAWEYVNPPIPVGTLKLVGRVFNSVFKALKSFAADILACVTADSALS